MADSIIEARGAHDIGDRAWADVVRFGGLIDSSLAWTTNPVTLSYFYKRDALQWSHTFGLWLDSDPELRYLALRLCDGERPSARDTYGWAAFASAGLVFAGKAHLTLP